jgi:hypothetical protein
MRKPGLLAVLSPTLHRQFDMFTSEAAPLMRKRSLFREEYDSRTLRGHFGRGSWRGLRVGRADQRQKEALAV